MGGCFPAQRGAEGRGRGREGPQRPVGASPSRRAAWTCRGCGFYSPKPQPPTAAHSGRLQGKGPGKQGGRARFCHWGCSSDARLVPVEGAGPLATRHSHPAPRPAPAAAAAHLVHQPGDEHVAAHGGVLVQEAGALLAALALPQQAGLVDHPAEGDGPRDAPCGGRGRSEPRVPRLRRGGRGHRCSWGCSRDLDVPPGDPASGQDNPVASDPTEPLGWWGRAPSGQKVTAGPSSGLLGNGTLPRPAGQGHAPRVLTTIHWIPSAKDRCWSQTHLRGGATASRPGERGHRRQLPRPSPRPSPGRAPGCLAAPPAGRNLTEARFSLAAAWGARQGPRGLCPAPPARAAGAGGGGAEPLLTGAWRSARGCC